MADKDPDSPTPSTLIQVSEDPCCREASLPSLDTWLTPVERFYVRNHFSNIPQLDTATWRLTVEGEANTPLGLSYDELTRLPHTTVVATLECAGNSRSALVPPGEGLAFRHGAVSTAAWRGVSLRRILLQAGMKETAQAVLFEGADIGSEEEEGQSFELAYQRSLPLEKALHPDTLLAYEMNGTTLTPAHGFPIRLVVPGWYGMASVKWLVQVRVLDRPFDGFFQGRRYVFLNEGGTSEAPPEPVAVLRVKSLITRPRMGEVLPPGAYTIRGFAWSGAGHIHTVEVSTNGGRHWQVTTLSGTPVPNAWRPWEFPWQVSTLGRVILMARATDTAGNTQPSMAPWNYRGYANNSIHVVPVEVASGRFQVEAPEPKGPR